MHLWPNFCHSAWRVKNKNNKRVIPQFPAPPPVFSPPTWEKKIKNKLTEFITIIPAVTEHILKITFPLSQYKLLQAK